MKRPPGIWILLSAGVLWLSLQDVYGIRATALIFGKSSTTTTTETSSAESSSDEAVTEASTENSNVTKPTLTGNPQLDYLLDPNLPKELNGLNLSEYPFYERVPEDIDFKCDGLHDGFYASVPHKCQVYHHCLFGTRYDFLCANYTAFDQKTFICHFVSEVDCVNSKKYWHRNDALYQAASTTTIKPLIVYTPPPQPHPAAAGAAPAASNPRRPAGRRRPLRRRRPQYDYYEYDDEYDDYYEERSRAERRRKRPRPRPRPVYDDDYEEYEDERYERRGSGRRDEERNRKPYDRRGSDDRRDRRRNKDRRKHEEEDRIEDDKSEEETKSEKRTSDRRYHKRRPVDDYVDEEEDRRRTRPKSSSRRPIEDDFEEEEEPIGDKSSDTTSNKTMIKPTSGSSIFDRPRTAPRIKPPVPKSEASKYAYKTVTTTKVPILEDEEYYDDYEEEPPKNHRKSETSDSRKHQVRREEERDTRKQVSSASRHRATSSRDESHEEETSRRPYKPKYGNHHRERTRSTNTNKKSAPVDDYYDEYEEEVSKESSRSESKVVEKQREKSTTSTTTTTTTTTMKPTTTTKTRTTTTTKPTTTAPKELRPESIVRIVKRPFLPSRGGNPYSSRGLQPVGAKALDKKSDSTESEETMEVKPIFKPSPVIIMPHRQKYSQTSTETHEETKSVSTKPQLQSRGNFKHGKDYSGPRTTQKPKLPDHDPLDIEEDEYDVTLNDALNPTLPNLPVRGYPTGFSSPSDYNYNSFQRPRYVIEEAANTNYYQAKPVRQRFEPISYQNNPQDHLVNSDAEYKGQYSTINRESYRPRITQAYFTRF